MSIICPLKEEAGMTVEWLFWDYTGTTNWTGTLSHSRSKVCVLPAFSVCSSVNLYACLPTFSFERTAFSKLTEIS